MAPRRRAHRIATMTVTATVLALVTLGLTACGGDKATGTSAASATPGASALVGDGLVDIGAGLHGRKGLTASTYATGLGNVAVLAFDAQGRLWAATADFEDKGADRVYLVPGAGATPVEVIEDVHTPLGLLWLGDALYVASKDTVEVFAGFDGTRFVDRRTVVSFPTGVGEVNGLVLAPDGRIQLGISAPCNACVPDTEYGASIVSFLPDGSDLRVDATDIRAPIDLAYVPGTSDLFVTMNQRDDLDPHTPGDWLALVHEGQRWGFPDCYGQTATTTGSTGAPGTTGPGAGAGAGAGAESTTDCASMPRPVAELDPHAAVSGLAIVSGELGPSVGEAAVVAEWAKGKVLAVSLIEQDGAYTGTVAPLVNGVTKPVAVELGPDRGLYLGDWGSGTVYRITGS